MTEDQARNLAVYGATKAEVDKAIAQLRALGKAVPSNAGSHIGQKANDPRRTAAPAASSVNGTTKGQFGNIYDRGMVPQASLGKYLRSEKDPLTGVIYEVYENPAAGPGTDPYIRVRPASAPGGLGAGGAPLEGTPPGGAPQGGAPQGGAPVTDTAPAVGSTPATPGLGGFEGVAPGFFEDYPYAAMQKVSGGMGVQPLGAFGRYLQSLVAPLMARYLSGQVGGSQTSVEDTFRQGLAGGGGVGPSREQAAGAFQDPNFQQYAEDPNNYDQALQLLIYGSGMPRFLQQWAAQRQVPNMINQFLAGSGSQGGKFTDFLRGSGNSFGVL